MQGNFHATYATYHSYICKYHLIICTLWIFILEMDAVMGGLTIPRQLPKHGGFAHPADTF